MEQHYTQRTHGQLHQKRMRVCGQRWLASPLTRTITIDSRRDSAPARRFSGVNTASGRTDAFIAVLVRFDRVGGRLFFQSKSSLPPNESPPCCNEELVHKKHGDFVE